VEASWAKTEVMSAKMGYLMVWKSLKPGNYFGFRVPVCDLVSIQLASWAGDDEVGDEDIS
jgi:hypothetical protein